MSVCHSNGVAICFAEQYYDTEFHVVGISYCNDLPHAIFIQFIQKKLEFLKQFGLQFYCRRKRFSFLNDDNFNSSFPTN